MKKFGTTALAVLSALSLAAICVSCGEKKKETPPPKQTTPPANNPEKPAGGAH